MQQGIWHGRRTPAAACPYKVWRLKLSITVYPLSSQHNYLFYLHLCSEVNPYIQLQFLQCMPMGSGDDSGFIPASKLLQLANVQRHLDDRTQCILSIQTMLASVIAVLLNVHPAAQLHLH